MVLSFTCLIFSAKNWSLLCFSVASKWYFCFLMASACSCSSCCTYWESHWKDRSTLSLCLFSTIWSWWVKHSTLEERSSLSFRSVSINPRCRWMVASSSCFCLASFLDSWSCLRGELKQKRRYNLRIISASFSFCSLRVFWRSSTVWVLSSSSTSRAMSLVFKSVTCFDFCSEAVFWVLLGVAFLQIRSHSRLHTFWVLWQVPELELLPQSLLVRMTLVWTTLLVVFQILDGATLVCVFVLPETAKVCWLKRWSAKHCAKIILGVAVPLFKFLGLATFSAVSFVVVDVDWLPWYSVEAVPGRLELFIEFDRSSKKLV